MFQRIVERMTKELTDTFHDYHSSRLRRGTLVSGKERKKKKIFERGWSGRTRSIARGACDFSVRGTEVAP